MDPFKTHLRNRNATFPRGPPFESYNGIHGWDDHIHESSSTATKPEIVNYLKSELVSHRIMLLQTREELRQLKRDYYKLSNTSTSVPVTCDLLDNSSWDQNQGQGMRNMLNDAGPKSMYHHPMISSHEYGYHRHEQVYHPRGRSTLPPLRGPFTLRNRNLGEHDLSSLCCSGFNTVSSYRGRSPFIRPRDPSSSSSKSMPSASTLIHPADIDEDWRNHDYGGSGDFIKQEQTNKQRPRIKRTTSSGSSSDGSLSYPMSHLKSSGLLQNMRIDSTRDPGLAPLLQVLEDERDQNAWDNIKDLHETVIFEGIGTVFVKEYFGFTEFGSGTLQVVDRENEALNDLKLLDRNKKEILQQYIYKWNNVSKVSEEKNCFCIWNGAASVTQQDVECIPERKEFKVKLSSSKEVEDFINAFTKSMEKANDESIRKRHISWYLRTKGFYKRGIQSTKPRN